MITKETALLFLRPHSRWAWFGSTYSGLEWLDIEQTKPTEAEIATETARLQVEYDSKEYQRRRAITYPSIQDQLDTLYHGGLDAWKASITAVKEEIPK